MLRVLLTFGKFHYNDFTYNFSNYNREWAFFGLYSWL